VLLPEAISNHLENIRRNLLERRHVECDFDFVIDSHASRHDVTANLRLALESLDNVVLSSVGNGDVDISGRAFMVMSDLLDQLADVLGCVEFDGNECALNKLFSQTVINTDQVTFCKAILAERDSMLWPTQESSPIPTSLRLGSVILEKAATVFTERCVAEPNSYRDYSLPTRTKTTKTNGWVVACASARVDLSGGWSDTPPVCFEYGGAVCGVAVAVDGMKPLSCRSRIVKGGKGILLRCESRTLRTGELIESPVELRLSFISDIRDFRDPLADCALLKVALVCLGIVSQQALEASLNEGLQPYINKFVGVDTDVGLEIVSTSLLPHGSGMGASSILAGCVLLSIADCIGIELLQNNENFLIQAVLRMEQLLTTGGGWQDQIGGLVGGFKLGTSTALELPLKPKVERLSPDPELFDQLNRRLVLSFTGHTRLAKNILQNVLRRWARRTAEVVDTVSALVNDAHKARNAIIEGDMVELANCLDRYWEQKKRMAGEDSGVEPDSVRRVLAALKEKGDIVAGSLCGAGGGGFMVMVAAEGKSKDDIQETCKSQLASEIPGVSDFTWHECRICSTGIDVFYVDGDQDAFDHSWHSMY
jgi:galactokinase/mevalonate kinase-like predicted kinase